VSGAGQPQSCGQNRVWCILALKADSWCKLFEWLFRDSTDRMSYTLKQ